MHWETAFETSQRGMCLHYIKTDHSLSMDTYRFLRWNKGCMEPTSIEKSKTGKEQKEKREREDSSKMYCQEIMISNSETSLWISRSWNILWRRIMYAKLYKSIVQIDFLWIYVEAVGLWLVAQQNTQAKFKQSRY